MHQTFKNQKDQQAKFFRAKLLKNEQSNSHQSSRTKQELPVELSKANVRRRLNQMDKKWKSDC